MAQRNKAESEEETIVSIEIVANNLRQQVELLDIAVKQWRDSNNTKGEGDFDGGRLE